MKNERTMDFIYIRISQEDGVANVEIFRHFTNGEIERSTTDKVFLGEVHGISLGDIKIQEKVEKWINEREGLR